MKTVAFVVISFVFQPVVYGQDSVRFLEDVVTLRQKLLVEEGLIIAKGVKTRSEDHDAKIDLQTAKKNRSAVGRSLFELVKLEKARLALVAQRFREGFSGSTDVMDQRILVLQAKARFAKNREYLESKSEEE